MDTEGLVEKCRLTEEYMADLIKFRNEVKELSPGIEETGSDYMVIAKTQLAIAIPIISAEARKQERKRIARRARYALV